jgi:putative spermidine/putrescine transport system permease protein
MAGVAVCAAATKNDRAMSGAPFSVRVTVSCLAAIVLGFLMLPILAVIPASFNSPSFITLPPTMVSWRWYLAFLADREWMKTLINSIEVAFLTTVIALILGTAAALGLQRLSHRAHLVLNGLFLAPLIVPVIVTAISLYRSMIDIAMTGSIWAIAVGHALLALPLVIINVGVSLRSVDPSWYLAAAGLGAGPWMIFRTITLPNIIPGVVAGAVFAAMTSFDEVVIAVFLASYETKTLPVKMWEAIRIEFTPVVAVAATVMILLAIALFLLARVVGPRDDEAPA